MKIIILVGISGSGKTTWSGDFIKNNETFVRINRDSVRETLIPNHIHTWYTRKDRDTLEKMTSSIVHDLIDISHYYNKDVILDNTNCDINHLKALMNALQRDYPESSIAFKIFHLEPEEAKLRVSKRDYPQLSLDLEDTTFNYIDNQYQKHLQTIAWITNNKFDII